MDFTIGLLPFYIILAIFASFYMSMCYVHYFKLTRNQRRELKRLKKLGIKCKDLIGTNHNNFVKYMKDSIAALENRTKPPCPPGRTINEGNIFLSIAEQTCTCDKQAEKLVDLIKRGDL